MDLSQAFWQKMHGEAFMSSNAKVLVAVSGGLDSAVLFSLLLRFRQRCGYQLGVVHVNHQMRAASDREETALEKMCSELGIPFFCRRWEDGKWITTAIEAKARQFRYDFFEEVMEAGGYRFLLTAHHGDDQIETILMRLLRGSFITKMRGIPFRRPLAVGEVVRPLLFFSRTELERYAKAEQLVYYQDDTNETDQYLRNRIRHHVVPVLKKENPKMTQHFQTFSTQLQYTDELVREIAAQDVATCFTLGKLRELDLTKWQRLSASRQFFSLAFFLETELGFTGDRLTSAKFESLFDMLQASCGSQQYTLGGDWYCLRQYKRATFFEGTQQPASSEDSVMIEGIGTYPLSGKEEMRCSAAGPNSNEESSTQKLLLPSYFFPVTVRRVQAGDYLVMDKSGRHKKVQRLFIDKKVPQQKRSEMWVVVSVQGEILWVPTLRKSYLSIPPETATIHYRLVYQSFDE